MTRPEINAPAAELLFELIDGPVDGRFTWVVSTEPDSGLLGTLAKFTAEQASRPPGPGRRSAASHAAHVLFSLNLATQRLRGENPDADWDGSWEPSVVNSEQWHHLRHQIRDASATLRGTIEAGADWEPLAFKGIIATVGHTAYHLGAIRQLLPAGSHQS